MTRLALREREVPMMIAARCLLHNTGKGTERPWPAGWRGHTDKISVACQQPETRSVKRGHRGGLV